MVTRCDRCGRDVVACVPSPCDRCNQLAAAWSTQHGRRATDLPALPDWVAQLTYGDDDDVLPCGCCSGSCYCDGDDVAPMLDPDFDAHAADYGHAAALQAILDAADAALATNQPKGA